MVYATVSVEIRKSVACVFMLLFFKTNLIKNYRFLHMNFIAI
jgi:hypothetical protein